MSATDFAETWVLHLKILAKDSEDVSARLWKWPGCLGIEEVPADGSSIFRPSDDFAVLEFGSDAAKRCAEWLSREAYRGNAQLGLKIFFEAANKDKIPALTKTLTEDFPMELLSWSLLEARDYLEDFRKSYRGQPLENNLWVGPPWETPPADREAYIVEPALAFGTGDHPTTQLCLERIKEYANEGRRFTNVLDLGTGSGILGIAIKRHFPKAKLWLTDLDPLCEAEVKKTFLANATSLEGVRCDFGEAGRLERVSETKPRFDLFISNIYSEVLRGLAPLVGRLVAPGGLWLISGVLEDQAGEDFIRHLEEQGFKLSLRRSRARSHTELDAKSGLQTRTEVWLCLEFQKGVTA